MDMIDRIREEHNKLYAKKDVEPTHIVMHIKDRLKLEAECNSPHVVNSAGTLIPETILGLKIVVDYAGRKVKPGEFVLYHKIESETLRWEV